MTHKRLSLCALLCLRRDLVLIDERARLLLRRAAKRVGFLFARRDQVVALFDDLARRLDLSRHIAAQLVQDVERLFALDHAFVLSERHAPGFLDHPIQDVNQFVNSSGHILFLNSFRIFPLRF